MRLFKPQLEAAGFDVTINEEMGVMEIHGTDQGELFERLVELFRERGLPITQAELIASNTTEEVMNMQILQACREPYIEPDRKPRKGRKLDTFA